MFRKLWENNKGNFLRALNPELVVLFGSYLKNTKYNDIDLLVVSKRFTNQNMFERKRKVSYFFPNLDVDSWCFPYIDYKNKSSILFEIMETGEILWQK